MDFKNCKAYELVLQKELGDIKSMGYLLRHKKSGARVALVSNDDENKVFSIGFRTLPVDSAGTPHILEHSVLCGSKKYPVKDPFVELIKSSLNTFLNAMTYPDKTIYPVASCNGKDFQNLMEVYLDAVFYPDIYKHKEIFCQEGWHYEMEDKDAPLTINGVVYNEMKGAFSSPEDLLCSKIKQTLFPDTPYAFESGGDPDVIPELTYEKFLEFHQTYYHPSNAYIYLYGDMDMEEKLDWMDKEYLGKFGQAQVESQVRLQEAFCAFQEVEIPYHIASGEPLEGNTYLSYNVCAGTILDKELYVAFDVLNYALLSAPGAPLKQALLDAKIGKDIISSYDNETLQPIFSIMAKNSDLEKKEEFVSVIRRVLKEQAERGVNQKALLAGINSFEFRYREADYGHFPKGLLFGLKCMDSWLYDDNDPFCHLDGLQVVASLKEKVGNGYFEGLIRTYLLDNPHGAVVSAVPQYGLNAKKEEALAKRLEAYKNSLSEKEVQDIVAFTHDLKQYQEEPSAPEDLAKLPSLAREDIKKEGERLYNRETFEGDTMVLCHDVDTNGIAYFSLLFDVTDISIELVPYLGVLKAVLGYVDTENYLFPELANEIDLHTGGIFCSFVPYTHVEHGEVTLKFEIRGKALYHELPKTMELIREIISHSIFRKKSRMYEILAQLKSRLQMALSSSGHSVSAMRAMSYFSHSANYWDLAGGIGFYRLVKELEEHFDAKQEALSDTLELLMQLIFRKDNLTVSIGAELEGIQGMKAEIKGLKEILSDKTGETKVKLPTLVKKNEGFLDASQVQYVSRAGNYKRAGFAYTGALSILKVLLSYDYLWLNVRVKGGAYGCMSSFSRGGEGYFTSYRDPNLSKTNEIYEGIPAYLEQFDADEEQMTKYILGTFSSVDAPLTPAGKVSFSLSSYLTGQTEEMYQKERNEILNATKEDIQSLSGIVKAILDEQALCVIGNEEKLKEEKDLFLELKDLY